LSNARLHQPRCNVYTEGSGDDQRDEIAGRHVIAPKEPTDVEAFWDRQPRRKGFIVGDPDELIHMDWASEWNPDPP